MQSWLGAVDAGQHRRWPAMQPIWSQPGEKVIRFEESLEHSRRRYDELLADLHSTQRSSIDEQHRE